MSTKRFTTGWFPMTRREFLRLAGISGVGFVAAACAPSAAPTAAPNPVSTPAPAVPTATSVPAPTPTSGPRVGGTLKVGASEGGFLGYPPRQTATSQIQASPVLETLFRIDPAGKPVPWLATGYKSDASAKTITLTLQRGVKFHDGTDFNAAAVKWNLTQYQTEKVPGTEKIASVEAVDDSTVRIGLSQWDSTVISNLTNNMGMMISPSAFQEKGQDWVINNPVGTGPFKFVSWRKDVTTVYRKFEGYWQKGEPYLDEIQWMSIADLTVRQLSLRNGEIDVATSLLPQDLADLEKAGLKVISRLVTTVPGCWGIVPDSVNAKSPFAELKVRQAASHAIDRAAIVQGVFANQAEVTNQWANKAHWAYNPSVVGYPYDPAKAKQLLSDAGYPNGFTTKLLYNSAMTNADKVFVAVQGFLSQVGINVQMDAAPLARWTEAATQGGGWDGMISHGPQSSMTDEAAALVARFAGGKSYSKMIVPDDYLKAIQNAVAAADFETEQKFVQEALKLMIDKYCLIIPLYAGPFALNAARQTVNSDGFVQVSKLFGGTGWTPESAWVSAA